MAALDGEPEVPEALRHVMQAFRDLSGTRTAGFQSDTPIQASEVEAWLRLHGYDVSESGADYWYILHRVDQWFRDKLRERNEG